jgi:hypothetical protein
MGFPHPPFWWRHGLEKRGYHHGAFRPGVVPRVVVDRWGNMSSEVLDSGVSHGAVKGEGNEK